MNKKPNVDIKLVKLPKYFSAHVYECEEGSVTVRVKRGKRLSWENVNWMLDKAKADIFR